MTATELVGCDVGLPVGRDVGCELGQLVVGTAEGITVGLPEG
jgi:hypothetical protein